MDLIITLLYFLEEEVTRENSSYSRPVNVQGHKVRWWTGGNDIGREGNWTWVSSQKPVGDFVWANIEPNGWKGENCLILNYSGSGCDYLCTGQFYPICQFNI